LFGGLLKAKKFVAANLPSSYDQSVSFFYLQKLLNSTHVVASIAVPCCLLLYALLLNAIHVVASIAVPCCLLLYDLLLNSIHVVASIAVPCCLLLYALLLNSIHVVASIAVPCCLLFVSCSLSYYAFVCLIFFLSPTHRKKGKLG
jgi:hypothetical protein